MVTSTRSTSLPQCFLYTSGVGILVVVFVVVVVAAVGARLGDGRGGVPRGADLADVGVGAGGRGAAGVHGRGGVRPGRLLPPPREGHAGQDRQSQRAQGQGPGTQEGRRKGAQRDVILETLSNKRAFIVGLKLLILLKWLNYRGS